MQDVQHITPEEAHKPVVSSRKATLFTAIAALGAGLVASLTSVAIMLVFRMVGGIPTPIELFGDHLLKLLPAARFVDMLVYFGPHSKPLHSDWRCWA